MIALHSQNDVNVQAFTQNQKGLQFVDRLRSKVHAKGRWDWIETERES